MNKSFKTRIVSILASVCCTATCGALLVGSTTPTVAEGTVPVLSVIESSDRTISQVSGTTYQDFSGFASATSDVKEKTALPYTGVKVDLQNTNSAKATLAGVFTDDFSMSYTTDSTNTKNKWSFIKAYDLEGNELFAVGRSQWHYNGMASFGMGAAYFAYYDTVTEENVYTSIRYDKNGAYTKLTDDPNATGVSNYIENASVGGTNYQCVLPNTVCAQSPAGIGKVIFDWDAATEKLAVKLTYRLAGDNVTTNDNGVTVWQTVERTIGEIDCSNNQNAAVKSAMEGGYKVGFEVNSTATSVDSGNNSAMNFILLDINGVSLAGETVAIAKSEVSGITYDGEYQEDGVNYITLVQGEELNAFNTVETAYLSDNHAFGEIAGDSFAHSELFAEKEVGSYDITVSYEGVSKAYTVNVESSLAVLDLFENEYNSAITKVSGTTYQNYSGYARSAPNAGAALPYTGVKVDLDGSGGLKAKTTIADVFTDDFSMSYTTDSTFAANEYAFIKAYDLSGNELFSVARRQYQYNGYNQGGGIAYFEYNGTYTTLVGTKLTVLKTDPNTINAAGDNLVNWETDCGGNNGQGVLPGTDSTNNPANIGKVIFDWDATTEKLAVKLTYTSNIVTNENGVSVYGTEERTIGEIDCSNGQNAAVKLAMENGYKVSLEADSPINKGYPMDLIVLDINGVSLADDYVASSVEEADLVADIVNAAAKENVITVTYGNAVPNFTFVKYRKVANTNWLVEYETQAFALATDYSTKAVGEYEETVTYNGYQETYTIVVQSPVDAISLAMTKGAAIRCTGSSAENNGIRYIMTLQDAYYDMLYANVGDGKLYKNVSYGIIIAPADYVAENALTVANLFDESTAVYGWAEKVDGVYGEYTGNKTQVVNLTSDELVYDDELETWCFRGSMIDIKKENVTRQFVGLGYIKYEMADGTVGYKMAEYYEGDVSNNTRSIYEVALAAMESDLVGTDEKGWIEANYITTVKAVSVTYYTVDGDVATAYETKTIYGYVGCEVFAPELAIEGYTFDASYDGSVLTGVIPTEGDVSFTLAYYFVKA